LILRLLRALRSLAVNPHNYYRELVTTNWRLHIVDPTDWLRFKTLVQREMASRRSINSRVETRAIDVLFPGILSEPVRIFPIPPHPFNVSWHELVLLAAITRHLKPKQIFEFGTFDGRTSLHLAANAPDDGVLHTIDITAGAFDFGADSGFCEPVSVGRWICGRILDPHIVAITGDSATYDFSAFRGRTDLVFIDADRGEAAVLRDSAAAFEMLASGRVVIWHDYLMLDSVTKALTGLAEGRKIFHVSGTTLALTRNAPPNVTAA